MVAVVVVVVVAIAAAAAAIIVVIIDIELTYNQRKIFNRKSTCNVYMQIFTLHYNIYV